MPQVRKPSSRLIIIIIYKFQKSPIAFKIVLENNCCCMPFSTGYPVHKNVLISKNLSCFVFAT